MFNWAAAKRLIAHSPFADDGEGALRHNRTAETARRRRLDVSEEKRLLIAASPHLRDCIEFTLDMAVRRGELLALRWAQVDLARRLVHLTADTTKTARARTLPITPRVNKILKRRRLGPDGKKLGAAAFVFDNEVGERIG